MRVATRALFVATVVALSIVGTGALVAAGDDGPPRAVRPDRPTRTILRPTEIPDLDPLVVAKPSDRPVCLLVAGIGSDAPDGTFDALVAALEARCEVHRFGGQPEHPYDTSGSLDANADELIREARDLAKTHPEIKIVAHSMGGAVVDEAFRRGLSADDKVTTYIGLAVPHNGSTEAKMGIDLLARARALGIASELRDVTAPIQDVGSAAVRDLATVRAGPPPPGVRRIDFRMATDGIVTAPDAATPGVETRTLLPSSSRWFEGHGGIVTDPTALALISAAVSCTPPDERGRLAQGQADAVSWIFEHGAPTVYKGLAAAAFAAAAALALIRRRRSLTFGFIA